MDSHRLAGLKLKSDADDLSDIYSASERKKGSRAPWTSQDMISAMLLVKQGMSITKAAQSLNIPRTTLRDRVTGKVRSAKRATLHQVLTAQDERMLLDYYKIMRKQGYGKVKEMIMYMAGKTIKKNGNMFGELFTDEKWWQSFCSRHNLPATIEDEIYGIPKHEVNEAILNNCTQQLFDALTASKYGINFLEHPELIYTCNENMFCYEDLNKLIVELKWGKEKSGQENGKEVGNEPEDGRVDGKILVNLTPGSNESRPMKSWVVTCANALGQSLSPLFVQSPSMNDTVCTVYEKYTTERLDDDFFLLWFHEAFLPNVSRRGPCILVYDGNNCLITREMLMAASVNDVIMFCIPSTLSHELQTMDMSVKGLFSETWKNALSSDKFENGITSHSNFLQLFKAIWSDVATEALVADRFKAVGICPFTRPIISTTGLNAVFENEDFGGDKFGAFMGADSDVSLHGKRKDVLMMKNRNPSGDIGEKGNFDGSQHFMRPSGRITRPTMSMLNQPLNESAVASQIIADDEEFREDFPEITNSADDFSSCSDEGNTQMVALSSGIPNLSTSMPPRHLSCPAPGSQNEHVTPPTIASQKRHFIPKATEQAYMQSNDRIMLSSPGNSRNAMSQFQGRGVIHSVSGAISRKRSSAHLSNKLGVVKAHPSSTITLRHSPQDLRSDIYRNTTCYIELHAFEEVLDQCRKAKFVKALEAVADHTEDLDPLYQLWKTLKLRCVQNPNAFRSDYNPLTCQVNQVSPSLIEITPKTSNLSSTGVRQASSQSNHNCHCPNGDRTICTPAGNVTVSKNATVIVIMPEKKDGVGVLDSSTQNGDTNIKHDTSNKTSTSV